MTTSALRRPLHLEGSVVAPSKAVLSLSMVLGIVAAVAAAIALLASGRPKHRELVTARGQTVEVYGTWFHRHDSSLIEVGNRGTDAVTLFLEVPVLLAALIEYWRRLLRSNVVLVGVLGWLLYCYASMSLYTACNGLFEVYVVPSGLALFAAPPALRSIDPARFAAVIPRRQSRRLTIGCLCCIAAALTAARLPALVAAAATGHLPARLSSKRTLVTGGR